MAKGKESKKYPCHCNQCGYDWQSKKKKPMHCAKCISDKWDVPLIGKKLRSAVPSRARLVKGHKGKAIKGKGKAKVATRGLAAPKKGRVKGAKNSATDKSNVENAPGAHGVFPKKLHAPRVKKEKGTSEPVKGQADGK